MIVLYSLILAVNTGLLVLQLAYLNNPALAALSGAAIALILPVSIKTAVKDALKETT